jgi:hypothetical protein
MNNAELFHRWANQTKPQGKSGNVFYEGPILYSYGHHFPLAVLTGKKTGPVEREIVLVNSRSYSQTTAKHKGQAVRASSHLTHIYVPHPTEAHRAGNLEYLNGQTRTACERLENVRSGVDYAERTVRGDVETAKLYRKTFLKGRGKIYALPKDFDALLVKARERETRHDAAQAVKEERYKAARELSALAEAEKIAAWRAGENVSLSWNLPCMLRLKGTNTVETSLRAEVPLTHARRLYGLILGIMAAGADWETNGHTIPVGVYKVDKITKDGTLHAGCHTITFGEIDRFAGERDWR